MIYRLIVVWLTSVLRIYFRQLEIVGAHRVPDEGPVIFVLNHPNGLVDPVVIMCFAPRQITFLGKAPLFNMFFIGWVARAIEAVPVYRLQDEGGVKSGGTQTKNQITFDLARKLLSQGKSIAIFPEGVSHSDTKLKPLKSGAARIALGSGLENLKIVPAGLFYTEKREFRSSALLYFGEPFSMPPLAEIGTPAEPDRLAVRALTDRIKEALDEVTLQAEKSDALKFIERAERIFSSATVTTEPHGMALPWSNPKLRHKFLIRRQFMARYTALMKQVPEKLAVLETRVHTFEAKLQGLGLKPEHLIPPENMAPQGVARGILLATLRLIALPLVILGFVGNYATYRLVEYLSKRIAKTDEDLISTIKVLSAMALFPAGWLIISVVLAWKVGFAVGVASILTLPLSGYIALVFLERIALDLGRARAIWLLLTRRALYRELQLEQVGIRDEILSYGAGD